MPESNLKELYSTLYQKEASQPLQSNKRKGVIRFALIGVILIALPLIIFFVFRPQDIRQRASQVPTTTISKTPVKTLAFFNKTAITDKEVDAELKRVWGIYLKTAQKDPKLRQNALNTLIERKIVQEDAQKLSIKVSSQQDQATEKEDLLVKLSKNVLTWKKVETVSVFKDPFSPTYAQNVAKAKTSLERIRTLMSQGKSLEVAYTQASKELGFDTFITYESPRYVYDNTKWGKSFLTAIKQTPKGSYTEVIVSQGGSLMVASVLDEQKTDYATIEEYIAARKKVLIQKP